MMGGLVVVVVWGSLDKAPPTNQANSPGMFLIVIRWGRESEREREK